ncbi:YkvI family membrane protein [Corynebacterium sp. S7]
MRRSITIALAFVGLLVGAGFATGQEVVQYFVSFGYMGLVGAVIAGAIMIFSGAIIFQLGSYFLASDHNTVFKNVAHPWVSKFLDLTTTITLFAIGFVMLAGAGSNLEQQFGWPTWIGSCLMTALVLLTGFLDVDKVTNVISAITPFIIIAIVVAFVITLVNFPEDTSHLNAIAMQQDSALPHWLLSAVNYTALALMLGVSMILVIGGNQSSTKAAFRGGVLGGVIFTAMLLVLAFVIYFNIEKVGGLDLPLLGVFDAMHPAVGFVVSWIIYAMIYNTAIGMFYALAKRLTSHRPERFVPVFIAVTLAGFVVSFLGFSNLLGWVYPVIGYIGMVMIAVTTIAWFRGRHKLKKEEQLRERMAELAEQNIDPEQDELSPSEVKEVKQLARTSRADGKELWETVQHDVAEDLDLEVPDASDSGNQNSVQK